MERQETDGVRRQQRRKRHLTPLAIVLLGICLAGVAFSRQGWITGRGPQRQPVTRATEERESDMPPPGYLMRRWGMPAEPQPARKSMLAPDAPLAVSNWVPVGPTHITDVGSS